MEFIVENGSYFKTWRVDYHGGLRYPHLERASAGSDVLTGDREGATVARILAGIAGAGRCLGPDKWFKKGRSSTGPGGR